MRRWAASVFVVIVVMGASAPALQRGVPARSRTADAALNRFWQAQSPQEASAAVETVVASGISFDAALARLRVGSTYARDVPRGVVQRTHRIDDTEFPYVLDVPESYTPTKKYQVRVQLHGGVNRPEARTRESGIGSLAGVEQIYVMPVAWAAAEWWTDAQLQNLRTILDEVKRTYNVDENRVVLSGVSDGGTATFYVAMRDTTPFASFLPLNGALPVLRSRSVKAEGELFPNNLLNKPFFVVNGGRDPLYPPSLVEPVIEHLSKGGVNLTYMPQPEGAHNTAWWPEVKDAFESFVREHPRVPLPEKLTWESDLTGGTNRAHWLVIDALASDAREQPALADLNQFSTGPLPNFGLRVNGTTITSIADNSNASIYGFRPNDVVVSINGKPVPSGANVLDVLSSYEPNRMITFGVRRGGESLELTGFFMSTGESKVGPLFQHTTASGRVDLAREGNTVRATTRGVQAFTLLLSPDAFDFTKPVTVVCDGKTVFEGGVTASVATLMKWAARDNDRTMLFGAELPITLSR